MAQFSYRDCWLNYVKTEQFVQESVYDASGTDLLGIEFRIVVTGWLSERVFPRNLPTHDPGGDVLRPDVPDALKSLKGKGTIEALAGVDYPNTEEGIREWMMKPRHKLVYADEEFDILLESPGRKATTDDRLGPIPLYCNPVKVAGMTAWQIEFAIKTFRTECRGRHKSPILSNRWAQSISHDEHHIETRTHTGRLILRAGHDVFTSKNPPNADDYRSWTVPPLPVGYTRTVDQFKTTENGLELEYTVVDKQDTLGTRAPAVKIEGYHIERTTNGCTLDAETFVKVRGHPNADKLALLAIGMQIILSRIGANQGARGEFVPKGLRPRLEGILRQVQVKDIFEVPVIEIRAAILKAKPQGTAKANQDLGKQLGTSVVRPVTGITQAVVNPVKDVEWGFDSSRIGLPVIPGTTDRTKEAGFSLGDHGTPGFLGLKLLHQYLTSPCDPDLQPGPPRSTQVVESAPPTVVFPGKVEGTDFTPGGLPATASTRAVGTPQGRSSSPTVSAGTTLELTSLLGKVGDFLVSVLSQLPPIPTDRDGFMLYTAAQVEVPYTLAQVETTFKTQGHNIQLPVASNGATARAFVARTAAPTSKKLVKWTMERVGKLPEVPNPDPKPDPKTGLVSAALNDWDIVPHAPELAPDGVSLVYRISGFYEYLLGDAVDPTKALEMGSLPHLRQTVAQTLPTLVLVDDILDSTQPAGRSINV